MILVFWPRLLAVTPETGPALVLTLVPLWHGTEAALHPAQRVVQERPNQPLICSLLIFCTSMIGESKHTPGPQVNGPLKDQRRPPSDALLLFVLFLS